MAVVQFVIHCAEDLSRWSLNSFCFTVQIALARVVNLKNINFIVLQKKKTLKLAIITFLRTVVISLSNECRFWSRPTINYRLKLSCSRFKPIWETITLNLNKLVSGHRGGWDSGVPSIDRGQFIVLHIFTIKKSERIRLLNHAV